VWLPTLKTLLIRARANGILGIVKEGEGGRLGREEEGVRIEAEVEDEAILAIEEEELSHVMTMRTGSRRTTPRTDCQLISVPFIARRAIIRPTIVCIRSSRLRSFKSKKPKEKAKLKEM
jgi:hypothetical protein